MKYVSDGFDDRYDVALQRFSIPFDSIIVGTKYGHTHLLASGPEEGDPVVLLHGSGENALMWESQMRVMAECGFRVYVPDIIGHSAKSAPRRLPYRGNAYSEWLSDVLDALNIPTAVMGGFSTGGYTALKFAAHYPQRVTRLILISTVGLLKPSIRYTFRGQRLVNLFKPRPAVDLMQRFEPSPFHRNELSQCSAPTLLLVGENESYWQPQALIERANQLLPNLVAAEIVPSAGDHACVENVDFVNAQLLGFLQAT